MNLGSMKQAWAPLAGAAAWLATLMATFLSFSVQLSLDANVELAIGAFSQFVVAALFGILVALNASRRTALTRARASQWSIGLLIVFAVLYLCYFELSSKWTCLYANRYFLVIGTELLPDALAHVTQHPQLSACNALIAEYGGDTSKIYESGQMRMRFICLAILHTLLWVDAAGLLFMITRLLAKPAAKTNPAA